jgi:hypothetical protein
MQIKAIIDWNVNNLTFFLFSDMSLKVYSTGMNIFQTGAWLV